ncbi:MAG: hypothetical protein ACM36B_02770 [Bacteroidota bacterium]
MFGSARGRRILAAAACAAAFAVSASAIAQSAPGEAQRVTEMTAAEARAFTLDQIRALAAIARAGGQQQDAQCRAAAVRAGHLGAAAIDAVVHADKARERALRAVGAHAADDPAVQETYQRVATATLDARHSVTRTITACPDLAALR